MSKNLETEVKVGLFVTIGVALIMLSILVLGGSNSLFSHSARYRTHWPAVDGLISGSKVVLSGLRVGSVENVDFDPAKKDIVVDITVERKYMDWIRKDSHAEISTQGVLGDKYISLTVGSPEQPMVADGAEIEAQVGKDFTQFLSKSDQLMASLNSITVNLDRVLKSFASNGRSENFFQGLAQTSKSLAAVTQKINESFNEGHFKSAMKNLDEIMGKINNGTGTLGALVNDPGLYYEAKALTGGANRNRIVRNLVRKTIKDNDAEAAEAARKEKK